MILEAELLLDTRVLRSMLEPPPKSVKLEY